MKLILDFDDVFFKTADLKARFFNILGEHGIQDAEGKYHYERKNNRPFSLRQFIDRICKEEHIADAPQMYEEVMSGCKEFLNASILTIVKEVGKENCYILTNGNEEFQKDKIVRSEADTYVKGTVVVPGSKAETIESWCLQFGGETIIFVEDKTEFLSDIDMEKCPNLKTVLFNEHGLENLQAEIEATRQEEQKTIIAAQNKNIDGPKMK